MSTMETLSKKVVTAVRASLVNAIATPNLGSDGYDMLPVTGSISAVKYSVVPSISASVVTKTLPEATAIGPMVVAEVLATGNGIVRTAGVGPSSTVVRLCELVTKAQSTATVSRGDAIVAMKTTAITLAPSAALRPQTR